MKISDGAKKSNCFLVALLIWSKDPKHRSIKCKIERKFHPPHFWVETDSGYQIHWKSENKNLPWIEILWFKGKVRKRYRKRLDISPKSDRLLK